VSWRTYTHDCPCKEGGEDQELGIDTEDTPDTFSTIRWTSLRLFGKLDDIEIFKLENLESGNSSVLLKTLSKN
jgi:hypothetical protein